MKAKRLTIAHPEGDLEATSAHAFEKDDSFQVRLAESRLQTSDVVDCPITVSGPPTDDAELGRIEREWTYHGEVVDVDTVVGMGGATLTLTCHPPNGGWSVLP